MVTQVKNTIVSEIDKLNENESLAVLNYISEILSNPKSRTKEILKTDELIGALADRYENKRARQVVEWERVRRQNKRNI